ncbi:unnamed protein product [Diabrotica balteata]|uniref:Uncharacterized protein n=1 Tax=Diabrotica balteata TaxID=107213 RepID=A0A9N9XB79_DIABA|nr:unnamed protein product [Diabrotica balteata]
MNQKNNKIEVVEEQTQYVIDLNDPIHMIENEPKNTITEEVEEQQITGIMGEENVNIPEVNVNQRLISEMSHYSRNKNEHRLYLSPMLSVNKMYELYKNQCSEQNLQFVKNSRYRQIFVSEFNFGFGSPKSDTCKVCDSKNNDEHVRRYKAAFEEQKKDRNLANEGTIVYINFDMQKTLPLPKLSTSVAFYLRQVWLYNLGIHCVSKGDSFGNGFFHLWTEDKGGKGPEEVGSSILSFFQNINIENIHLVAWSDSAGGQNKNFFIDCLWHYLVTPRDF